MVPTLQAHASFLPAACGLTSFPMILASLDAAPGMASGFWPLGRADRQALLFFCSCQVFADKARQDRGVWRGRARS
jgi:hypothetical protein